MFDSKQIYFHKFHNIAGIKDGVFQNKLLLLFTILQKYSYHCSLLGRKQKQEQYMQSRWYIPGAKKNVIRIDKKGNGLSRLWKQMITKFPLASLETAEAIAVVYPTPLSLFEVGLSFMVFVQVVHTDIIFQMYELLNESDGEKLLQDIPIRRGAGPICIMRKIGPELSRKIYNFFTAVDPDKLL